jgi:hypothetical protein
VFDDHFAVVDNKDTTSAVPLSDLWRHDFWGQVIARNDSNKSFRPLTVLSFRLDRLLTGIQHPGWFHFVNVALHSCVAVLVFRLAWRLYSLRPSPRLRHHLELAAFQRDHPECLRWHRFLTASLSACLYAVHPAHSEAVCGVVGRAELLQALLGIAAFLLYIGEGEGGGGGGGDDLPQPGLQTSSSGIGGDAETAEGGVSLNRKAAAEEKGSGGGGDSAGGGGLNNCCGRPGNTANLAARSARVLAVLLLLAAAVLSKETAVVLAVIFLSWDVVVEKKRGRLLPAIAWGAVVVAYLALRHAVTGNAFAVGHEVFRRVENPAAFIPDTAGRLMSKAMLQHRYISPSISPSLPLSLAISPSLPLSLFLSVCLHTNTTTSTTSTTTATGTSS